MQILHWNIRGYYSNFEDLKLLLKDYKSPACVCLQETFHGSKIVYPPSKYYAYSGKPQTSTGPRPPRGLVTLVHKDVPHTPLELTSDLDIVAIKIHAQKSYTVVNLYVSPQENINVEQFRILISQLRTPFLIIGDFNARNPLWGDTIRNSRGDTIERCLAELDLTILNTGIPTHYHVQTNSTSCIDLSLCSADCYLDFSWGLGEDCYRSDHYPVYIDEIFSPSNVDNLRYNFSKANWHKF